MNRLFQKLTQVLRKQYGPNAAIKPFSLGRVYQCTYRNWHHDPRPLLLILGSDVFYTLGINIHYLGGFQNYLTRFIIMMRQSNMVLNGLTIYNILKLRYPTTICKRGIRKYFTAQLRGKLVSEGISTAPEQNIFQFLNEPFVQRLNKILHPPMFSRVKPPSVRNTDVNKVRSQIIQTQYYHERQRPFANKTVVQYRPQPEEEGTQQP